MKATAETIRSKIEDVGLNWIDFSDTPFPVSLFIADIVEALPITLEQLAGIANGEWVLADKGDLIIPAALRGDPDKVSKAHAAWVANGELVLTDAKELERLKGTLRYIGTQAVSTAYASNPKLALSVIAQNVSAALNDEFQATVRSAMLAASPEKDKTT